MSSKEKILQVALDQFYKRGYQSTSVDDIIEQAGVSKSNFYYHFKSKEDLGIKVLSLRSEEFDHMLSSTLCNADLSPADRLLNFLNFLSDSQEARLEKGGCPFGNLVAEMADHSERFRCQLSEMFGGLTNHIAQLVAEGQKTGYFRKDVDTDCLATLVVQTMQGMLLMTKCHKSVETLGQGSRVLIKLIQA
jgi:TetR/AcrR family transcriptional repressor of nem operon